jgi:hypothetical protein
MWKPHSGEAGEDGAALSVNGHSAENGDSNGGPAYAGGAHSQGGLSSAGAGCMLHVHAWPRPGAACRFPERQDVLLTPVGELLVWN